MGIETIARRMGTTRWFARLGRATSGLDRRLQQRTRGRWSMLGRATLPQLILTTTGRVSGEPRAATLLFVRDGERFVVLGSNWGQEHHPAWSSNLLAQPHASVTVAGETTPVVATIASDEDRARLMPALLEVWPGYAAYAERSGRELRMFTLTPHA